jgi:hypothetical protein
VLIPGGFMAGPATSDLPVALVLCTAQGAIAAASDVAPGQHDERGKPAAADAPCLFAGLTAAAPPPVLTDAGAVSQVAYAFKPQAAAPDLAPGRGLTGPPLPARGPPTRLI